MRLPVRIVRNVMTYHGPGAGQGKPKDDIFPHWTLQTWWGGELFDWPSKIRPRDLDLYRQRHEEYADLARLDAEPYVPWWHRGKT